MTGQYNSARARLADGLNAGLGVWLIIAPWIYGFTTNVAWLWTSVIVGVAVMALATWSVRQTHPERGQRQHA